MLAARATSKRELRRIARSFATVVDTSSGFKVASVEAGQPTSSVTLLVKAGSRFEPLSKPGIAHGLKGFAFKGTAARSALGTVRESELYGGVLSSSLSREHLALTAEFLPGDEQFFVDVLTSFVTSTKYTRHEFNELVRPILESELVAFSSDNATRAMELAHSVAFRSGLGSSIYAPQHPEFTAEDIKSFASNAFSKDNVAIIGTDIDQGVLTKLVEKSFGKSLSNAATTTSTPSSYFGGSTRVDSGGLQTLFVGYGVAGAPSPEHAVLAAYLSPQPSVKWSKGVSPLATSLPEGVSVQSVYLPYSDAALLGVLIQADAADKVKEAGKAAAAALKAAGSLKGDDLKQAIAKAKFTATSSLEERAGVVAALAPKLLHEGTATLDATFASLDKVTATGFAKSVSNLIKSTPTSVAIGDIRSLPHVDELGL